MVIVWLSSYHNQHTKRTPELFHSSRDNQSRLKVHSRFSFLLTPGVTLLPLIQSVS